MNEELILKSVAPYVKNNSITYKEFENLFYMLEKKEQYEVADILFKHNIELRPEDEEEEENSSSSEKINNEEQFMDSDISDELEMHTNIKQSNEILCVLIQQGNKQAEQDLCIKNRRLVDKWSAKYDKLYGNKLDFEDLEQLGYMGLILAAKKFEPSKGYAFSTYAVWWIKQAIIRGVYDTGFTIRLPVHIIDSILKIQRYERMLELQPNQIDYKRKLKIIAKKMGESVDFVKERIKIREKYLGTASLNAYIGEDEETELEEMIIDTEEPLVEDIVVEKSIRWELDKVMLTLTPREKRVLDLRFGLEDGRPRTLEEVGKIFGVTRERIRQIEAKALRKMRHPSRSKNIRGFLVG